MADKDRKEYMKEWRGKNRDKTKAARDRYHAKDKGNPNFHKPWTEKEIRLITARRRASDAQLAKKLGRSTRAIQEKRHALKNAEQERIKKSEMAEAVKQQAQLEKLLKRGIQKRTERARRQQEDLSGNC